jgi:hypothetical protein
MLQTGLRDWQTFYTLIGTATATLIGLLFIAVSLATRQTTQRPLEEMRAYTAPTLVQFVVLLLISAVMLIPAFTLTIVGSVVLALGGASLGYMVYVIRLLYREHQLDPFAFSDWLWNGILPSVCYLGIAAAAFAIIRSGSVGLGWLPVPALTLLAVSIRSAWGLLVWILSHNMGLG